MQKKPPSCFFPYYVFPGLMGDNDVGFLFLETLFINEARHRTLCSPEEFQNRHQSGNAHNASQRQIKQHQTQTSLVQEEGRGQEKGWRSGGWRNPRRTRGFNDQQISIEDRYKMRKWQDRYQIEG